MSWGRRDDMRSLNPKIGQLTDAEYRALDGLMDYVCRSHMDGSFSRVDLKFATYLTPKGPRHVTQRVIDKLIQVGLVDPVENPANPHDYYIHDWLEYNPKDPTAAERMRNYRRNKDRNGDRNATVTRARAARPVPQSQSQSPSNVVFETSRERTDERDDDGNPLKFEHMRRLGER